MVDVYYRSHDFRYIVAGTKKYPDVSHLVEAGAFVLSAAAESVCNHIGAGFRADSLRNEVSALLQPTNPATGVRARKLQR